MINALPIVGWAISAVANISLAFPFWLLWTVMGFGRHYFPFVPSQYQDISFWNCVGLFMVASILKAVLTPKFSSVSHSCKCGKEASE